VGALHLLDAVLPTLLRQSAAGTPAHLSLVASVAGYRGLPNALAYGPTKAALINLAEVLYLDLHDRGHRRVADQPRLRRDAADRAEPVQDAGTDHARAGRAGHRRRLGGGRVRDPLPQALHPWLKALRPDATALLRAIRRAVRV
jgi:NAD(P)-dependent dehydrogenase (short-subunit alcohol dehydrogenase family)